MDLLPYVFINFFYTAARKKKLKTMNCDEALPLKIAIDLAFDDFMDESVRLWIFLMGSVCFYFCILRSLIIVVLYLFLAVNKKTPKASEILLCS